MGSIEILKAGGNVTTEEARLRGELSRRIMDDMYSEAVFGGGRGVC